MLVKVKTRIEERFVLPEVIESIQSVFDIMDQATSPPPGDPKACNTLRVQAHAHFDEWWSARLLADWEHILLNS